MRRALSRPIAAGYCRSCRFGRRDRPIAPGLVGLLGQGRRQPHAARKCTRWLFVRRGFGGGTAVRTLLVSTRPPDHALSPRVDSRVRLGQRENTSPASGEDLTPHPAGRAREASRASLSEGTVWVAEPHTKESTVPAGPPASDAILLSSQSTRPSVGVPVAERLLTDSLVAQARRLYPPGAGRSAYLLPEADTRRGRPDLLVVHVSSTALGAHAARGLRVPSPAAAYAITSTANEESRAGMSATHMRRLRQEMLQQGWTQPVSARTATLVHFSVAIEAKVRDWRRGFRQVSHWGPVAHRSAILMPERQLLLVPPEVLRTYDVDLLGRTSAGGIELARSGRQIEPAAGAKLWLIELITRAYFTQGESSH